MIWNKKYLFVNNFLENWNMKDYFGIFRKYACFKEILML